MKSNNICQVGINAEKFEKTCIRFNSDVFAIPTIVILNIVNSHEHDTFVLPETRLIEGENSNYHDSLEELFILQNIADLKVITYKVFTFDFGF